MYIFNLGPWDNDAGELFLAIQHLALPAVKVMVTQLVSVAEDEYDQTVQQAFDEANTGNVSTRFRLIYAKKSYTQ